MTGYDTIAEEVSAEFEERRSRFIGHAAPVATEAEAMAYLDTVRSKNPEARHNVWAYILHEGSRERQSDDGEPQKTAGLPTLEVLRHAGLQDIMVVTTRYFGGTLLGTGGLVRAYTQAAQLALETARRVTVSSCVDLTVRMPYGLYDRVSYAIRQAPAKVRDTSYTDLVTVVARMVEGTQDPLVETLRELMAGTGTVKVSEPRLAVF